MFGHTAIISMQSSSMLIFGGFTDKPQQHDYSLSSSSLTEDNSVTASSSNALYRFSFESKKWYLITPHVNTDLQKGKLTEPIHRFFHSASSCFYNHFFNNILKLY
jgi:hypothetical protein